MHRWDTFCIARNGVFFLPHNLRHEMFLSKNLVHYPTQTRDFIIIYAYKDRTIVGWLMQ